MARKGGTTAAIEELFAHEAWLRRVAGSLGGHDADDLVQEAWIAAMRSPPEADRPVRPWLARVVRNLARMRHRGQTRRAAREQAVVAEGVASPETLVAQLEAHQRLGALILALEEGQRQVLLLSFGEGLTSAQIATRLGVPAGTVRWRLKGALDELRLKLGVEREPPRGRFAFLGMLWKGLIVVKTSKVAAAGLVLLIVAFFVGKRWIAPSPASSGGRPAREAVVARKVAAPAAEAARGGRTPPAWMAHPGARPRRIAGKVVSSGEPLQPLAGARVRLLGEATEAGMAPVLERVTGPDGAFDFGPQPAAELRVAASAPGREPLSVNVDIRGPNRRPQADALLLELPGCTATVFGAVEDADGVPLAGAQVSFERDAVVTTTDEEGSYELCVPPSRAWLTATAPGLGAAGASVAAKAGAKTRLDFTLGGGVPVVCEVLRQEDGTPVAGAHVIGYPQGDVLVGPGALNGITDSSGRVRFEQVLPAKLHFAVVGDGVATTDSHELDVAPGRTNELQILVETMGRVRGTVRDERGAPVVGALLQAGDLPREIVRAETVTQEDGSFVLAWLPDEELELQVRDYIVVSPKTVTARGEPTTLDVRVSVGRRIAGRVTRGGKPTAGARVMAMADRDRGTTESDDAGAFELHGLKPKIYRLLAATKKPGAMSSFLTIDLRNGDVLDVVVDVPSSTTLSGILVDEEGGPVAGADIRWKAIDGGLTYSLVTAADGTFRKERVIGGLDLEAEVRLGGAPLLPVTPFPIARLRDSEGGIDLRLVVRVPRATIAGVVVDGGGDPVAGVLVEAHGRDLAQVSTRTGADGTFRLDRLVPGAHELVASTSDGTQRARLPAIPVGANDVRIVLGAGGSITGTLSGFKTNAEVRLQSTWPPYDLVALPATYRSFEARALVPGEYVLTAQTATEQAVARVTVTAGAHLEVELTAQGSGTITGTVVELGTGKPVSQASCRFVPRAGDVILVGAGSLRPSQASDDRGVFSMPAPAGDLRITCFSPAHSQGSAAVTVLRDQTATVQITVIPNSKRATVGFTLDPWSAPARILSIDDEDVAAAGLRAGDVITAVDGTPVTGLDRSAVQLLIAGHPAGTAVEISTQRGVATITLR